MLSCSSYYKKAEHYTEPSTSDRERHTLRTDQAALGTDGPVPVGYLREYYTSHQHWHQTLNNLGILTNEHHLSGSNVGVWTNLVSVEPKTVTRAYSATTYWLPNRTRENLILLTGATARAIILKQQDGPWKATGIKFEHDGAEYLATAKHEVIVCGGSVASPQLLELSGIGDPAVLNAAGIDVKVSNENVGRNVQEHMSKSSLDLGRQGCTDIQYSDGQHIRG
jgi:choline dehydrogenase-like flavoprotein